MKIANATSRRKTITSIGCVVALISIIAALELTGTTNFTGRPVLTPEQKQEADANADAKKDFIENNESATSPKQGPNTSTNTTPVNSSDNVVVSAKQEANGSVTVMTKLYNYSNGLCKLEVANGSKTISQTAQVIYQPEFSTCAGFTIPKSQLGSGEWTIKLIATTQGVSVTKTVTLEVK